MINFMEELDANASYTYSGVSIIYYQTNSHTKTSFPGHKVLVIATQPGDIAPQLHAIHHLSAVPTVSFHSYLRTPRDAALRRPV